MEPLRSPHHRVGRVGCATAAAALVLVLGACTPNAGTGNAPGAVGSPTAPPTASPTAAPSPDQSARPYLVPGATAGEITRAVFEQDGPGGVPTTEITLGDGPTEGQSLVLRGDCVGTTAEYEIQSAAVEGDLDVLARGTLTCGNPSVSEYRLGVSGPVQIAFVDADRIERGWLLLTTRDGDV
jgi:hypothetical protein